jgi:hypothetical protein
MDAGRKEVRRYNESREVASAAAAAVVVVVREML